MRNKSHPIQKKKDKKTIKDSYREENNVHDPDKIELS